tara:strand:- start:16680 stop:17621 length:942 start_codon:yes stop_codon:yes gene_type:complete
MKKKLLVLCGGVGGAKLAYGLSKILPPEELIFLVNTGDDFEHLELHISPDLDTVMYTLSGINDPERGWGLRDETWSTLDSLKRYGVDTWFQLGDKDLATHIRRTQLLNDGKKLSEVTEILSKSLGLKCKIIPMSEDLVQTVVKTTIGDLPFQEYFVKHQCEPIVKEIVFSGKQNPQIPLYLESLLKNGSLKGVIICPSNPYLSIDPILSIKEIKSFLSTTKIPVLAVSPIIDNDSIKGPTAKIMKEMGIKSNIESIAKHYEGLINLLIIDKKDIGYLKINQDKAVSVDSILMDSEEKKISLAEICLKKIEELI